MNFFELPNPLPTEEMAEILHEDTTARVERIVSTGQASGWYNQAEAEYAAVLQGEARLEYEDGRLLHLKAGEGVFVPPHQKHRVAFTSAQPPCIWLCFFYKT